MERKRPQRIFKIVMLIILTSVITFMITSIGLYNKFGKNRIIYNITSGKDSVDINEKFSSFKDFIEDKYIGEIDENKMIESAIKGYVEGLGDQYSEYITAEEMKEYLEDTNGKYVGVGTYITSDTETNQIIILSPIKGSPAEEIGLKAGDIIAKVDGVVYKGEELSEAAAAMKGIEGTKVKLEIIRGKETLEFEVERRTVKVNHIESNVIANNIGYIKISTFDEGCYEEFLQNYNELKSKNIKSLIIDLRNNGGGIVDEALNIADTMVEKGKTLLVTTSKNYGEDIRKSKQNKTIDIPIVILVNGNTASASEILTAAIKENENCKVVGTNTFGKGVIQTIYTLKDGAGLKITTNEYFTAKGNKINKVGIKPDYEIEMLDGNTIPENQDEDVQLQKAIELLK